MVSSIDDLEVDHCDFLHAIGRLGRGAGCSCGGVLTSFWRPHEENERGMGIFRTKANFCSSHHFGRRNPPGSLRILGVRFPNPYTFPPILNWRDSIGFGNFLILRKISAGRSLHRHQKRHSSTKGEEMAGKRLELAIFAIVALGSLFPISGGEAEAGYYRRQYYTTWTYRPRTQYYYTRYYYRPYVRARTFSYHYVIYFPSRPRYRYYYNPVRRVYWGRFEVDAKGKPVGYSMLKPADQKGSLEEIPETAFPKPSDMPPIPESKDGELMSAPPKFEADKAKKEKLGKSKEAEAPVAADETANESSK